MGCAHHTRSQLARFAPMPCPDCHGWVERDGSVMDRATTIARYPSMSAVIATDFRPPDEWYVIQDQTRGDQVLALISLIARTLLVAFFAAVALALVIFLMVNAL
jgi:hypothetical protein